MDIKEVLLLWFINFLIKGPLPSLTDKSVAVGGIVNNNNNSNNNNNNNNK